MTTPTAAHAKAVEIAKNWMTYVNKWNYGVILAYIFLTNVILTYDMIHPVLNNSNRFGVLINETQRWELGERCRAVSTVIDDVEDSGEKELYFIYGKTSIN